MKTDKNRPGKIFMWLLLTMLTFEGFSQTSILAGENVQLGVLAGTHVNISGHLLANESFNVLNQGTLSISGDIENNSGNDLLNRAGGLVRLSGEDQGVYGDEGTNFHSLELAGDNSISTLFNDAEIAGSLELNDATLEIGSNRLHILSTNQNAIRWNSGFIQMNEVGGLVVRSTNSNFFYDFPVGHRSLFGNLRTLTIQPASDDLMNFEVGFYAESAENLSPAQALNNKTDAINRLNDLYFHTVNQSLGEGGGKMSITGVKQDSPFDNNFNNVAQWDAAQNMWVEAGFLNERANPFGEVVDVVNLAAFVPNLESETFVLGYTERDFVVSQLITPNGDRLNDSFVVNGLENFPEHKVSIYNRWGDLVFVTSSYQNDWAGIRNGKQLPNGTYYYVVVLKGRAGTLSGYLELLRE